MKKVLLILAVVSLYSCKKEDNSKSIQQQQPIQQPVITQYLVDIEQSTYNTYIYINDTLRNPEQGSQQFNLVTGDSMYVHGVNWQFAPRTAFKIKVDGILLYQANVNNNNEPKFSYVAH